MNKLLDHEASQFIEQALLEEPVPSRAELARVRRSLLRAATAMTVTTGAAPLAAKSLASKIVWFVAIGKSTFVGAVVVGMSIGTVALGGGAWLVRRVEQARQVPSVRAGAASVTRPSAMPKASGEAALQPDRAPEPPSVVVAPIEGNSVRDVGAPIDSSAQPSATTQPVVAQPSVTAVVAARPRSPTPAANQSPPAPAMTRPANVAVARFAPVGHASLSDELAGLEQVQRAVNRGEATQALALLDRLNANAGNAGLGDERLALEALAACQTGQYDRGYRAEQKLLQRSPNSPLAARIRAACASKGQR